MHLYNWDEEQLAEACSTHPVMEGTAMGCFSYALIGHELHESGTMDYDIRVKRGEFISKSTVIRETFFFASPV